MLSCIFFFYNTNECDIINMNKVFFLQTNSLVYIQPKGARPAHGPTKYCHALRWSYQKWPKIYGDLLEVGKVEALDTLI